MYMHMETKDAVLKVFVET